MNANFFYFIERNGRKVTFFQNPTLSSLTGMLWGPVACNELWIRLQAKKASGHHAVGSRVTTLDLVPVFW